MTRSQVLEQFVEVEKELTTIAKELGVADHHDMCRNLNSLPDHVRPYVKALMVDQIKRIEILRSHDNVVVLPLSRRFS